MLLKTIWAYTNTCEISFPQWIPGSCLMSCSVLISILISCLISGLTSCSIELVIGVTELMRLLLALVVTVVVDVAGAVLVGCVEPVVHGAVRTSTNVWGWLPPFWLRLVFISADISLSACNALCKFSNDCKEIIKIVINLQIYNQFVADKGSSMLSDIL